MRTAEYLFADEAETAAFAGRLAQAIAPFIQRGFTLYLSGELGAGKTFFTQQLLRAWGYTGVVKSPTYGLVEIYSLPIGNICHFDLYRLDTPDELEDIGFRDYWGPGQLCIVEWPVRGETLLPLPDLALLLQMPLFQAAGGRDCVRQLTITEYGDVDLLRIMKKSVKK